MFAFERERPALDNNLSVLIDTGDQLALLKLEPTANPLEIEGVSEEPPPPVVVKARPAKPVFRKGYADSLPLLTAPSGRKQKFGKEPEKIAANGGILTKTTQPPQTRSTDASPQPPQRGDENMAERPSRSPGFDTDDEIERALEGDPNPEKFILLGDKIRSSENKVEQFIAKSPRKEERLAQIQNLYESQVDSDMDTDRVSKFSGFIDKIFKDTEQNPPKKPGRSHQDRSTSRPSAHR